MRVAIGNKVGSFVLLVGTFVAAPLSAQHNAPVPQADTCTLNADGTAHVAHVVPVPGTMV